MDDLPLTDWPLCVVDVETTGASFEYGDRVVELGLIRVERGAVVATYEKLLDPGRPMSGGASYVTGITHDMLQGQPTFCDVWPGACELMKNAVIVGHNVGFDIGFLLGECRKTGRTLAETVGDCPILDTVRIARKQLGRGGNGLQRLAGRLGVPEPSTAHRALADCQTTLHVLWRLLEPHGGFDVSLERAFQLQGGPGRLSMLRDRQSPLPAEIAEALLDGVPVKISYLDASNKRTERAITPRSVRRVSGNLTLVAHCHVRNEQRTFKISRILSAVPISPDDQRPLFETPDVDRPNEPQTPPAVF